MISRTETMDLLYLKHGLKMTDLLRAVAQHELNDDEDIQTLVAENEIKKEHMIRSLEEQAAK